MVRPIAVACSTIAAWIVTAAAQPAPSSPGPNTDHAVGYYDARLARVVLVGGAGDPGPEDRDSVWSWTGDRWEPAATPGPPGRVNAGAAYDTRRHAAIVAGGSRKVDARTWRVIGDSWERDRDGWRRIGGILPRDHHALVEDRDGGVLMFGGIPPDRSASWPTDTWKLQDGEWRPIATAGPAGRGRAALAYDRARRQVVLFGGVSASPGPNLPQTFFDDTWLWDGERWRKVAEGGPRGRYAHAMVFDDSAGVVLLYGGAAAHKNAPLGDMWKWDGERWTEIPLTGPTPGHRYQPVMVYDRARKTTVLYGGGTSDTWEFDGRQWRQR